MPGPAAARGETTISSSIRRSASRVCLQAGAIGRPLHKYVAFVPGSKRVSPLAMERIWTPSRSEYAMDLPSGEMAAWIGNSGVLAVTARA